MGGRTVSNASLGQVRQNSRGLLGALAAGATNVLGESDVRNLAGLPSTASVIGAVMQAADLEGTVEWSPTASALLPDVLPVPGALVYYNGSRQLSSGGAATHAGSLTVGGDITTNGNINTAASAHTLQLSGTNTLRLTSSALYPITNNVMDLGLSGAAFRDLTLSRNIACAAITASGNIVTGGLTINPTNGAVTFLQTFGIVMQTSNMLTFRHGNNDYCAVRPVSASGTYTPAGYGALGFANSSNALGAYLVPTAAGTLAMRTAAHGDANLTAGAITASGGAAQFIATPASGDSKIRLNNYLGAARAFIAATNPDEIALRNSADSANTAGLLCGAITASTVNIDDGSTFGILNLTTVAGRTGQIKHNGTLVAQFTAYSSDVTFYKSVSLSGNSLTTGAITASGTITASNQTISVGSGGSYYIGPTGSYRLADYVNLKSGGNWGLMDVAPMTNLQSGLIRIYNDVQNTTNYERLEVGQQTAADAVVRTAAGGTGTRRGLTLDAPTTTFIGNLTVNGGLSRFGASGGGYLEIPSNSSSLVGYFAGSERGRISFGGGTGHDTMLLHTGTTYLGSAASGNSVVAIGLLNANTTVRTHVLKTCDRSALGVYTGAGHHLQIMSGDPSGTDMAGGDVTVSGGRSTGTGLGGSIKFQTAPAGTTGSSLNALVDRLTIDSSGAITIPSLAPLRFASANHRILSDNSSLFLESSGDLWFRLSGGTTYARVNQTNATAALRGMWAPTFCVATSGTTAMAYLTTSGSDVVLRSDVVLKIRNLADSAPAAFTCGALTIDQNPLVISAVNPQIDLVDLDGVIRNSRLRNQGGAFRIHDITSSTDQFILDHATGAITATGSLAWTPQQSSLNPTTTDIPSGRRVSWYNSTLGEFRDWINIGGTLLKSAAYT